MQERDLSLTYLMRMSINERDMLLKNVDVVARARAFARLGLPAEGASDNETLEALARADLSMERLLGPQEIIARANTAARSPLSVLFLTLATGDRLLERMVIEEWQRILNYFIRSANVQTMRPRPAWALDMYFLRIGREAKARALALLARQEDAAAEAAEREERRAAATVVVAAATERINVEAGNNKKRKGEGNRGPGRDRQVSWDLGESGGVSAAGEGGNETAKGIRTTRTKQSKCTSQSLYSFLLSPPLRIYIFLRAHSLTPPLLPSPPLLLRPLPSSSPTRPPPVVSLMRRP